MRKVIFMIVLCLSLTACTPTQQSVIVQKREEPPYPYFLTSDQYELNGDGVTDFFGIYTDPAAFYEYGKAYPDEMIHVFFNNEPYTQILSKTYDNSFYYRYDAISIVGGDYDRDSADEIAFLRYCDLIDLRSVTEADVTGNRQKDLVLVGTSHNGLQAAVIDFIENQRYSLSLSNNAAVEEMQILPYKTIM